MVKKFALVCFGVLALAAAFQICAMRASATTEGVPVAVVETHEPAPAISLGRCLYVITESGDCYYRALYSGNKPEGWQYFGNIFEAER
jgi:hypothetical protein